MNDNITMTGEEWEAEAQRIYTLAVDEQRRYHDPGAIKGLFRRSLAASAIAQTIQLRRIGNKLDALNKAP